MASQATLRELWLQGPEDRLCGREQAKAWALREVWLAEGKGEYGLCTFVGLATLVRCNSVNGADVLAFSEASCIEALRCTPFAARKLLALRDKYVTD